MSTTFPKYRLYDSTGITLLYTFENTTDDGGFLFNDGIDFAEHTGLRGVGSNIIKGSVNAFNLPIELTLISIGTDDQSKYINLITQIQAINTAIVTGTKYILKVDLDFSTTKDIKVMRLLDIDAPLSRGQRKLNFQKCTVTFRANSWK